MRALRNPRPKQMDPISIPLCPRARVAQAAGARPGVDEPMSQFFLLGVGFIDPKISPVDCQACCDRRTGEISGSEGSAPRENGAYHQVFRRPGRPGLNWSLRLGLLVAVAAVTLAARSQDYFLIDQQSGDENSPTELGMPIYSGWPKAQSLTPAFASIDFVRLKLAAVGGDQGFPASVDVRLWSVWSGWPGGRTTRCV